MSNSCGWLQDLVDQPDGVHNSSKRFASFLDQCGSMCNVESVAASGILIIFPTRIVLRVLRILI
jgi:hypothetical protein